MRPISSSQTGAALLELAIAIPVLLLIFFGMVKYSNLMRLAMTMTQIAYESGRQAVLTQTWNLDRFQI